MILFWSKCVKNIAILCDSNPMTKPRPARLIRMLQGFYHLFVFGKECPLIQGVKTFSFPPSKSAAQRTPQEQEELLQACRNKNFDKLLYTPNRLILKDALLSTKGLDLLIVEDITLLPFALEYKKNNLRAKVMIDLREYYPLEYENDAKWLESFGAFFKYLCDTFLPQVDRALCVSEGIAHKYQEVYNICPTLFLSLPPYSPLTPSKNTHLELIYHGLISPDRESFNLLEIAKGLKEGIRLNLITLSNHPSFLKDFHSQAQTIPTIKIHTPKKLEEIIPFTNAFDLGVITLKPNGFNNTHALPNKFFEYIQARLGVMSTPLPSITPLIEKYGIGKVSKDFQTSSLIALINSLTLQDVIHFKSNAHKVSPLLSTQENQKKILHLIAELLGEKNDLA